MRLIRRELKLRESQLNHLAVALDEMISIATLKTFF